MQGGQQHHHWFVSLLLGGAIETSLDCNVNIERPGTLFFFFKDLIHLFERASERAQVDGRVEGREKQFPS